MRKPKEDNKENFMARKCSFNFIDENFVGSELRHESGNSKKLIEI